MASLLLVGSLCLVPLALMVWDLMSSSRRNESTPVAAEKVAVPR